LKTDKNDEILRNKELNKLKIKHIHKRERERERKIGQKEIGIRLSVKGFDTEREREKCRETELDT
jgi:hypothetical protein